MIDANLATFFDYHQPFPSSCSHLSHVDFRAAGLTQYTVQQKSIRNKKSLVWRLEERNKAKWRDDTFSDSFVMHCNSVHLHLNEHK